MADEEPKDDPVDNSTSEELVDESEEDGVDKKQVESDEPLTAAQKDASEKAFVAAQDAMGFFAEAYLTVMQEMGVSADTALNMLGWAFKKSPMYVSSTRNKVTMSMSVARLFGRKEGEASVLLSTAASIAIDAYVEHVREKFEGPSDKPRDEHLKKCKYCATKAKIEKEPEKEARFVAELWLSEGEDPGVVIQKVAVRLEMTQDEVADVFRSLTTLGVTPPPIDVLEEMIKRGIAAEGREILEELREHGHKVN